MVENNEGSRRKDIDRDISTYISNIRKKESSMISGLFKSIKSKKKDDDVELHPEVVAYDEVGTIEKKAPEYTEEKITEEDKEMQEDFEEGAKKASFFSRLRALFSSPADVDEDVVVKGDYDEDGYEEVTQNVVEEDHAACEIEEEYNEEAKSEGFLRKLFNSMFMKSEDEEEFEELDDKIAEDNQDMKDIAEISTKVMKMLPPDKMKELKESPDFEKFKHILKKREIIK